MQPKKNKKKVDKSRLACYYKLRSRWAEFLVLCYNITHKKNPKKSHLGVDLLNLWPYTVRTIRATEEGKSQHKGSQVDPPAGNVKRKPDTGVQYTPGA